jgi:tRNA wybutosine-synthesizing protein 1
LLHLHGVSNLYECLISWRRSAQVDRPLFPDFWQRFLECVDALARKGQRTVFRLTLVRDWNMNEVPPKIHTVVLHFTFLSF